MIKNILKTTCSIFIVLSVFSCNSQKKQEAKKETKQPNIIWIMAEDMSLDLECYGMPAVKTPYLNKMADEGIRFDNAFVTNPICSPSRSAMMIGTHQVKTNTHNHRSNRDVPLDEQFKPFTSLLRNAGYTTILGHHGVMKKGRKIDVNFKHEPLGEWDGKTKFGLFDKYDTFEKEDEPFFAQIQLVASHRGDWWNEVREQSEHPVNPDDVILPEHYADHPTIRLDWAKYLDQVEYLDNEVGMIFKELEDKGMADNTVVIFIGDNGRCNIRGKGYLHDPGLRIPFIIYYPKDFKGGQIRKEVVSATDITASILDFANVEIPDYMTGKPIFNANFNRDYVYAARDLWDEIEEKSRAITSGEWKYIRNDKPKIPFDAHQAYLEFYRPAVHVMRTLNKEGKLNDAQKFFFADSKPKEELYNLKIDPQELNNLANHPDYASKLAEMRNITIVFDDTMKPISNIYNPTHAGAVDVLQYVKAEKPEQYKQMQEGVEIGFKKMTDEYKKSKKK
ncbi:sulfatase [Tamlana sp. 2_MG-2023]|uniref:sulfatase family protein n=1 Tax=unclassified Tamlana TaxID=2614803 RepID=UPI0026E21105|nr:MULTISPECIES: sulfatase [unclassified Tamlana]MDO6760978.1 sulfatase [Tamlana sp. 2_MG-2023]MDO6791234.1 sulfatase [Tamlana sp. 1_MG-2023]